MERERESGTGRGKQEKRIAGEKIPLIVHIGQH